MDLKLHFKGGGSFTKLKPVFSLDEESVYVAWKNKILGYSAKTGHLFTEFKGFNDRIVGFGVTNFDSGECVVACSSSGEITLWKSVTNFKVFSKHLSSKNIIYFYPLNNTDEKNNLALICYEEKKFFNFALVNIEKGTTSLFDFKIKSTEKVKIAANNDFFVVSMKNNVYVMEYSNFKQKKCHSLFEKRTITSLAVSSDSPMFLTGDNTGRVILWQNILTEKPTKATFHWHTLRVNCIAFSASSSYFYSGGNECVLVRWQTDNNMQKKFLPRMAAFIENIGVSQSSQFLAVATTDNAIRIVDNQFNEITLIQHLVIGNNFDSGILLDPRTKSLVMNGNVGHIQFYSPFNMNLLYNVDIVGQNKITNERNNNIENTQITKIALSRSGLWMATVEERKDVECFNEIRLKFWKFDESDQLFKLNTSIEYPHEKSINAVQFQNINDKLDFKCVTVSNENNFKVWKLSEIQQRDKKSLIWQCHATCNYRNHPCNALSFSIDGSLMAIGFGPILTTWLPDTCELKCSLVYPGQREPIQNVQFGTKNQCHLVVTATKSYLSVWNLLTLSMVWTVNIHVGVLIADSLSENMAVVTREKKLFVFTPNSSEPVYSNDKILEKHQIVTASFIPYQFGTDSHLTWCQRSQIFFIDNKKELYCISGDDDYLVEHSIDNKEETSLISKMIPTIKSNGIKSVNSTQHLFEKDQAHKSIKNFLEAPIHTMLPIRWNCANLLKSMVLQKNSSSSLD